MAGIEGVATLLSMAAVGGDAVATAEVGEGAAIGAAVEGGTTEGTVKASGRRWHGDAAWGRRWRLVELPLGSYWVPLTEGWGETRRRETTMAWVQMRMASYRSLMVGS